MKLKATAFAAICLLMSLTIAEFSIGIAQADQGHDWNYGASSTLYASKWQQRDFDITMLNYALPEIYNIFEDQGSYQQTGWYWDETYQTWFPIYEWVADYGELYEFRTNWWWELMRGIIQDSENDPIP